MSGQALVEALGRGVTSRKSQAEAVCGRFARRAKDYERVDRLAAGEDRFGQEVQSQKRPGLVESSA